MPKDRFPLTFSVLTPRKKEKFAAAIALLDEGVAAGEIPNARFNEAKDSLSRALDYAWSEAAQKPYSWNRTYLDAAGEEERAALYDISGPPQVNTIAKMSRQADALGDTPAGRALRDVLAEASQVLDLVKQAKAIAVKKKPAARAQSATERYSAPAASKTAMAVVLAELRDITGEARDGLAASLRARHENMLTRYLDAQRECPAGKRYGVYDHAKAIGKGQVDPYLRRKLEAVTESDRTVGSGRYRAKADAAEIMARLSAEEADAICASFVEKNLSKLAPIIEGKGCYRDMKVLGRSVNPGAMEGRLRLNFEDGSSFEARSQAVMSFSHLGTPFMRFPLTFHDVVMPDGSRMERPSEKKMNEIFSKDISTPEP